MRHALPKWPQRAPKVAKAEAQLFCTFKLIAAQYHAQMQSRKGATLIGRVGSARNIQQSNPPLCCRDNCVERSAQQTATRGAPQHREQQLPFSCCCVTVYKSDVNHRFVLECTKKPYSLYERSRCSEVMRVLVIGADWLLQASFLPDTVVDGHFPEI